MTQTTRELSPDTWRAYFDDLSRDLKRVAATVEIESRDLGTQIEAQDLILTAVTYDDRDDVLVIGLDAPGGAPEDLEHLVYQRTRILIDQGDGVLPARIDIEDGEGHRTRVRLRPVAEAAGE